MRRILSLAVAVGLAAFAGCNKGTEGGATNPSSKNHVGQGEGTFSLTAPALATHLKQGESKVVTVGISRGKNFDQDVSLKFEGLPKGVTVDPSAASIKHGAEDAKVTVKAADDAAVGDFTVKVVGHPGQGADSTADLKLTVATK